MVVMGVFIAVGTTLHEPDVQQAGREHDYVAHSSSGLPWVDLRPHTEDISLVHASVSLDFDCRADGRCLFLAVAGLDVEDSVSIFAADSTCTFMRRVR